MTLMGAFGCGLIGFGPIGVLFCLTIARDPLQIIFFTLSAFFWLVALLAASVIWFAVVPLRDHLAFGLVLACLIQEVMRFSFYLLVSKAESCLRKIEEVESQEMNHPHSTSELDGAVTSVLTGPKHNTIFDLRTLAFTSGLSFAAMGSIIEYVYIFYDIIGPGTLWKGPNPGYFFIFAGLNSCFMGFLQISWSIILFRAFRLRLYTDIVVVCAIHVAISTLTLLNEWSHPAPELVCAAIGVAALGFHIVTFFVAGGRFPFGVNSFMPSSSFPTSASPNTTTVAIS